MRYFNWKISTDKLSAKPLQFEFLTSLRDSVSLHARCNRSDYYNYLFICTMKEINEIGFTIHEIQQL